jgi:hypothetical protein
MGIVKIYSYSSELLIFVEEKWVRPKLAVVSALIGISLFFGMIKLNQSAGFTSGARAAKMLVVENSVLRQELIALPPRLSTLEVQTKGLGTQDNDLHALFTHQEIIGDSVTGFTNPGEWLKLNSLNSEAINSHP